MRKIAILLTAVFALVLAGSFGFEADATVGSGTQGLPRAAKTYSPIDQVSAALPGRPARWAIRGSAGPGSAGAPAANSDAPLATRLRLLGFSWPPPIRAAFFLGLAYNF